MRKLAILSDIHGNLEALDAILRDVDMENPDAVVILGDTIGYGADPRACFERAAEAADVLLMGNHEKEAIAPETDELGSDSREVVDWAKGELAGLAPWEQFRERAAGRNLEGLASARIDDHLFVHGSPEKPLVQYVWPGHPNHYVALNRQIDTHIGGILRQAEELQSFCGHTHVPALLVGYDDRDLFDPCLPYNRSHTFVGPTTVFYVPEGPFIISGLSGRRMILNPGSVGQPRDGDPRAAYAVYDGDTVRFRRVAYDCAPAQAKIRALPVRLDTRERFAERLGRGA